MDPLLGFPNLTKLHITGCFPEDLMLLSEFKQLKSLSVGHDTITQIQDRSCLGKLEHLERLYIQGCHFLKEFAVPAMHRVSG